MVYGYVPTLKAQKALKREGLSQKIDRFLEDNLKTAFREHKLAGISTSTFEFVSFRDEDEWAELKPRIFSGEISKTLGIDSTPSERGYSPEDWQNLIFFYFAMHAKDELLRRGHHPMGYANYSWQKGDTKRWLINLEDDGILASANIQRRVNDLYTFDFNFGGEHHSRVREIKADQYIFWPEIFGTFLKYAIQSGQTGIREIRSPEKFLSEAELKPYDPSQYHLPVDEFWLKHHFEHPLPVVRRNGSYDFSTTHFESISERQFGAVFPYLTYEGSRALLNFGILPHKESPQESELKGRKKHFMLDNRHMIRHMTITPEELPELMRAVYNGYSSVRTQMRYILDYARAQQTNP